MQKPQKKFWKTQAIILCLAINSNPPLAAVCTQTTIETLIKTKKRFVWEGSGCQNTEFIIRHPIQVGDGVTIDGSGKMVFVWKGKHPCDEKPSSETIFTVRGNKSVLKNFTIQMSPEGIHLKGSDNLVDNVTWIKICEDGLTNWGKNNVVQNSLFQNAPDKCIQTNGGSATFRNNTFRGCPRSIGSCSDKADPGNHPMANCKVPSFNTAIGNKVYGCSGSYGMRSSGKKSKKANGWLKAYENTFVDCKWALQSEEDGITYAKDNIISGGAFYTKHKTGIIYDCNNKISGKYSSGIKAPVKSCEW